jgi:amino acid transporter
MIGIWHLFGGSIQSAAVTVNWLERNRPLATLLMLLILGVTAAAVLNQLLP